MNATRVWCFSAFLFLTLAGEAGTSLAAQYELKAMTPEVNQSIANRQGRYEQLQTLKAQGSLGESNRGYVAVLQATPEAQSIADAENRDRQTIYQTIAEQNNLGASSAGVVETIFAEVQHEKARPGDSIQASTGEWIRK